MYIHFLFADGSNPYIAITHEKLFDMIRKYDLEQLDVDTFLVHGEVHFWTVKKHLSAYDKAKTALHDFAIDFQRKASELDYSYGEFARWQDFFEFYGKKYGLLREFRENCIC